jgi:hypothetical protein
MVGCNLAGPVGTDPVHGVDEPSWSARCRTVAVSSRRVAQAVSTCTKAWNFLFALRLNNARPTAFWWECAGNEEPHTVK